MGLPLCEAAVAVSRLDSLFDCVLYFELAEVAGSDVLGDGFVASASLFDAFGYELGGVCGAAEGAGPGAVVGSVFPADGPVLCECGGLTATLWLVVVQGG